MPVAFITGITGQDGSYLAELLLERGYTIHGMVRRTSTLERSRIEHLRLNPKIYGKRLFLHYSDLTDSTNVRRLLLKIRPAEIYHLAGQSQPGLSFDIPESTVQEVAMATLTLLEIARDLKLPPKIFFASSSEVFGSPEVFPQHEDTSLRPVNPYGCAKAFAMQLCSVYRQAYGLHICTGIAYNHESPRRGESFVTRKITKTAARIAGGSKEVLELGNLEAKRDWGYAPEYVEAMWRMLQCNSATDYILATGTQTTVRKFVEVAFETLGIKLEFNGSSQSEYAVNKLTGKVVIKVNPRFFRPLEPAQLMGNADKAYNKLKWRPQTVGEDVARKMAIAEKD